MCSYERGRCMTAFTRCLGGAAVVASATIELWCPAANAAEVGVLPFTVRCERARAHHDGDTFVCIPADHSGFTVRVASIDAPETGQAFWRVGRQRLSELASEGSTVACRKEDRYGRQVCSVTSARGEDVAEVMLSEGLAWYPERYAPEDSPEMRTVYRARQAEATVAARGLWAEPNPMPPWDCRAARRAARPCK